MNKGCIEKVWMLDPHDKSCPKELHDEIFEKIQKTISVEEQKTVNRKVVLDYCN